MTSIYEEIQIAIHGIWSRRWIALGIAWAIALLGWLVVAFIPNTYQAKARIYVEAQSILPAQGDNPLAQQQELDQLRQTLTSVDNLVRVVKETDLAKSVHSDSDMGAAVGKLRADITVVSQQDNLFEISATSSDRNISDRANANLSAQIVAKLIDIFSQQSAAGDRAENSTTIKILDGQIADRAKELAAAEQRRVDFEQRNVGMLGVGAASQRMDATRSELNQIDTQLVAAQSALAGLNGQLGSTPQTLDAAGAGGSVSPLAQAMGELAQARAKGWTDNHPDVIAIQRQIAAIRAAGGGSGGGVTRTPNPAYLQIRSMQAERAAAATALQARKADLESTLSGMAAKQVLEPGLAAEQDRLDRDYTGIKTQYDKLIGDREEARLRGAVQSEAGAFNFKLIDPPGPPSAPASPNRPLLLVGVLIAAIGAGAGTAFVMSQLRTTYATAVRLERATGLTVIGSITETLSANGIEGRRRKMKLFASASAGLFVMCGALVLLEFIERGMSA